MMDSSLSGSFSSATELGGPMTLASARDAEGSDDDEDEDDEDEAGDDFLLGFLLRFLFLLVFSTVTLTELHTCLDCSA